MKGFPRKRGIPAPWKFKREHSSSSIVPLKAYKEERNTINSKRERTRRRTFASVNFRANRLTPYNSVVCSPGLKLRPFDTTPTGCTWFLYTSGHYSVHETAAPPS